MSALTPPEEAVQFLRDLGADKTRHGVKNGHRGQRTLLDHLVGTWELLAMAGEREVVCLAGLFHSVYGTNIFRIKTLDLVIPEHREAVRLIIGVEAENLVSLFCSSHDRPGGIIGPQRKLHLHDYSAAVWQDLAAIEMANLIEQGGFRLVSQYM